MKPEQGAPPQSHGARGIHRLAIWRATGHWGQEARPRTGKSLLPATAPVRPACLPARCLKASSHLIPSKSLQFFTAATSFKGQHPSVMAIFFSGRLRLPRSPLLDHPCYAQVPSQSPFVTILPRSPACRNRQITEWEEAGRYRRANGRDASPASAHCPPGERVGETN